MYVKFIPCTICILVWSDLKRIQISLGIVESLKMQKSVPETPDADAFSGLSRTNREVMTTVQGVIFIFFFIIYLFIYFIKKPKIGEIHVQYMNNINITW